MTKPKKPRYIYQITVDGRECVGCKNFFPWKQFPKEEFKNRRMNDHCLDCRSTYSKRMNEKYHINERAKANKKYYDKNGENQITGWNGDNEIYC